MKISALAGLLGVALLAFFVTPAQSSPVPDPGAGVELEVLLEVDLGGLGDLLNALLSIILDLVGLDKCKYKGVAGQLEGLIAKILVYVDVNVAGIEVKAALLVLLGPLLEAVGKLVDALLGDLSINLSIVINLILNLLLTLNLELDIAVAVKLGKLLNVDVLALINLG